MESCYCCDAGKKYISSGLKKRIIDNSASNKESIPNNVPRTWTGLKYTCPKGSVSDWRFNIEEIDNANCASTWEYEVKGVILDESTQVAPVIPKADYESRPPTGKCVYTDTLPGANLAKGAHTVIMNLAFKNAAYNKRQWVLNLGQAGTGANHWLWNNDARIQFGPWNGGRSQIKQGDISKAKTLATVFDGAKYSLYIDGNLVETRDASRTLSITSGAMAVGTDTAYRHEDPFAGCIYGVNIYRKALTAIQVKVASMGLHSKLAGQSVSCGGHSARECSLC